MNELLTLVQALVPVIERFFVDIMVMAEDPALRQARLALLARVAGLTKGLSISVSSRGSKHAPDCRV